MYQVILNEVVPTYYTNQPKWVEMMRESILSTKDYFGVKRMLEEYFTRMYIK
jgi:starch phosphorylase